MKKHFPVILLAIGCLVICPLLAKAQGCSDAGFCTMGAMRPNQPFKKQVNIYVKTLELSHYVGLTRFDDQIYAYTADLSIGINNRFAAQLKLPYMYATGPMGSNHGLGDISYSFTYSLLDEESYQLNMTVGGKIPTSDGNQTNAEGRPLPMYYQTSLGTFDLVLGASFITRKWLLAVGYQHAFGTNGSTFLWGRWADTPLFAIASQYPIANQLRRGADVMLRLERNFRFSKFNFSLGLLPIYRINNDRVINGLDQEEIMVNSQGLALTGLFGAGYNLSSKVTIHTIIGRRLVEREKNPDGLSREFVNSVGLIYRF